MSRPIAKIELPLRLINETNAREHWRARSKRAKAQRAWVVYKLGCLPTAKLPLRVIITRIGPRTLDTDNLAASAKHVRDGVAEAIGVDDGDLGWDWQYAQERGDYGVRVEIRHGIILPASAK